MKITTKLFGVLCAASLVFCAACDGMAGNVVVVTRGDGDKDKTDLGDDDDGKKEDEVSYAVGSTVMVSGVKYLVIKNTEAGNAVAKRSPEYHYYPNAQADGYRDQLIKKHSMSEPYVLVFNTTTTKNSTATSFDDEYRILRNGVTYYRFKYRWENSISNFATMTADELRDGYAPTCITVDDYSAVYGNDLSKKFLYTYRFDYNDDGRTVTYSDDNWRSTDDFKDYVYINGNERNQYVIRDRVSDHASSYILRNPNNTNTNNSNEFFEFRVDFEDDNVTPKSYRLIANGDGLIPGGTDNKLYQATLRIYRLEYWSKEDRLVSFTVTTKKNNDNATKTTLTFDDLYERPNAGDDVGEQPGNGDTDAGGDTNEQPGNGGTSTDGNGDNPSEGDSPSVPEVDGDNSNQPGDNSASGLETYGDFSTNEGVGKYVSVSERTRVVNGIEVPETITFSVLFEDENAPMSKFTKVTFVPVPYDDDVKGIHNVIYEPKQGNKTYDFIDNFKAGYGIFGDYAWERPVSTSTPTVDSSVTLQDDATAKADASTKRFAFSGSPLRIELEDMTTSGVEITSASAASGGTSGKLVDENSRAEAIITFPAGNYTGYAVIYAPSSDHDAFYVKFGDGHIRVYADDPPPAGYKPTSRTPIKLSCDTEVTVRMVISPRSEKFTNKPVETGMYIDYVEFTKN